MPVQKKAVQTAVVRKTSHEAAFRKIRCPNCQSKCAVGDPVSGYKCACGARFKSNKL